MTSSSFKSLKNAVLRDRTHIVQSGHVTARWSVKEHVQLLRVSLLLAAMVGASGAYAQGMSGIGAFVPNTELSFAPVAMAGEPRVNWINGEYQETNKDLSVKVLGGTLDIARSWSQGRWWLNPAWAPLNFELDPLGKDVKVIERVGVIYERSGQSDLYMAKSKGNAPVYIKKLVDAAKQQNGWQWYDRFGNTITYDTDGRIQSYANPSGVKVSFVYDSANSARILDHFDRTIYTVTMSGGLITKVDDLAGRSVRYQWTGNQLTQVTDVMGNLWKYEYDGNGQVTSRTDPIGFKVTAQYSQSIKAPEPMLNLGRKGTSIDPTGTSGTTQKLANIWGGGRVGKFDGQSGCSSTGANHYLREQRVFEVTYADCRGNSTVYIYDLQGNELNRTFNGKKAASNQWDGAYSQKYTNARGYNTATTYDTNYQPLQITHPDGSVEKYTYEPVFGRQSSYTNQLGVVSTWSYDDKGNLTAWVEAKGLAEQRTTQYGYDAYAQLTKQVLSKNGDEAAPEVIVFNYTYDDFGNTIAVKDALGNITKGTYGLAGNLVTSTDPLNRITTYDHDGQGRLTAQTSPLGYTRTISYDAMGRRIKELNPLGHFESIVYGLGGQIKENIDREGNSITYAHNSAGDLIRRTSAEGNVSTTTHDEQGRINSFTDARGNVTLYEYGSYESDNANLLVKVEFPGYLKEIYFYDSRGRKTVGTRRGLNGIELRTNTTYDSLGREVAITSSGGKTIQKEYDGLNRITKIIDADGYYALYSYNIQDKQTEFVDANGNVHKFEYDKLGRLVAETRPEGGRKIFVYDSAGQLKKRVNPNGEIFFYDFDNDSRLKTEKRIGQNSNLKLNQTVSYAYDDAGQVTSYVQIDGADVLISKAIYNLNKLGKASSEVLTYGEGANSITVTLAQGWNRDQQKTSQTYPDGRISTFTYDRGLLKSVTQPGGSEFIAWSDYEWNQPKTVQYPSVTRKNSYDGLLRVKQIQIKSTGSDSRMVLMLDYDYDVESNIVNIDRKVGGNVQGITKYEYDNLNRVTKVNPSQSLQDLGLPVEEYSYDAVHNRISSAHQPGEWKYLTGNRLSQWGAGQNQVNYTYNESGSVIHSAQASGDIRNYEFDASERLVTVSDNINIISTYRYDPMGRRICKTVGQGANQRTTWYAYSDEGLLAEIEPGKKLTKTYGWIPGSDWGTNLIWQGEQNVYHYIHNDLLGTPQIATNREGRETWFQFSTTFGAAVMSVDRDIEINIRFPGQYWDIEKNSNYNYNRDYLPLIGRYSQSDPIGIAGGSNEFSYSLMNPLIYFDNFGLEVSSNQENSEMYRRANNCYSHAVRRYKGNSYSDKSGNGGGMDPGGYTGKRFSKWTCADIKEAAKRDGAVEPTKGGASGCEGDCPDGLYKIKLLLRKPNFLGGNADYHWHRQEPNGTWSSKRGGWTVTNSGPYCPQPEDKYPTDCGFLCSKM